MIPVSSCWVALKTASQWISKMLNIKNIFRIIAEVSGFNLVLSPDVSGTVNIRLIDVPWNKAFELILENNALGRVCEGNIIRVVPNATLLAAQVDEPWSRR